MRSLLFGQRSCTGLSADSAKGARGGPGKRPNSWAPPWAPTSEEPLQVPAGGKKSDELTALQRAQFCGLWQCGIALVVAAMMLLLTTSGGLDDSLHWILFRFTGVSLAQLSALSPERSLVPHDLLELGAMSHGRADRMKGVASRAEDGGRASMYFSPDHTQRGDGGRRAAAAARSRKRSGTRQHSGESLLPERLHLTVNSMDVQMTIGGSNQSTVHIHFNIEGVPVAKWHADDQKLLRETIEDVIYHKVLAPLDSKSKSTRPPKHATIAVALAWDAQEPYIRSGALVRVNASVAFPELGENDERLKDFKLRAQSLTEKDIVGAMEESELSDAEHPYLFHVPGSWPHAAEAVPTTVDDGTQAEDDDAGSMVLAGATDDASSLPKVSTATMRSAKASKSSNVRPGEGQTDETAVGQDLGTDEDIVSPKTNAGTEENSTPKQHNDTEATRVIKTGKSSATPEGAQQDEAAALKGNSRQETNMFDDGAQLRPDSLLLVADNSDGTVLTQEAVLTPTQELTEAKPAKKTPTQKLTAGEPTEAPTAGKLTETPIETPNQELTEAFRASQELVKSYSRATQAEGRLTESPTTGQPTETPTPEPTAKASTGAKLDGKPPTPKTHEPNVKREDTVVEKGSPADGKFKEVPFYDEATAKKIDAERLDRLQRLKINQTLEEKKVEEHEQEAGGRRKSAASIARLASLTVAFAVIPHITHAYGY